MEEAEIGARAVAVPLVGPGSRVFGAISVSGPAARLSQPGMRSIARLLRAESAGIVRQLG